MLSEKENELLDAALKGKLEKVKSLVEEDIDLNCQSDEGYTPLMYASRFGHFPVANYLIKNNADVNMGSKYSGQTALYMAVNGGNCDIVKLLVENGSYISDDIITRVSTTAVPLKIC